VESSAPQTQNHALSLYRPLVEKVLAALGALFTHQLAYLVASLLGLDATAASDHGHLSLQWAIVAPVAVGAICLFIVWQLKGLGFRTSISTRYLGALIAGFFLIQEFIEGFAEGLTVVEVATHPAIVAGVVLAPLVAWCICRLMAGVTDLAARFLSEPAFGGPPSQPVLVPIPIRCPPGRTASPSRPRAPPSRLRI